MVLWQPYIVIVTSMLCYHKAGIVITSPPCVITLPLCVITLPVCHHITPVCHHITPVRVLSLPLYTHVITRAER